MFCYSKSAKIACAGCDGNLALRQTFNPIPLELTIFSNVDEKEGTIKTVTWSTRKKEPSRQSLGRFGAFRYGANERNSLSNILQGNVVVN